MQLMPQRAICPMIFMFAEGQGKQRLSQSGAERPVRYWSTFGIVSGEIGIVQAIKSAGSDAPNGVNARCLDIDNSNAPIVTEDVLMAVEGGLKAHHGHVGPAFIEYLLEYDPDSLCDDLESLVSELADMTSGGALQKRASRPLALLQLCGVLMQEANLISQEHDIASLIHRVWSTGVEADQMNPIEKAISNLQEFIASNKGGRICHDYDQEEKFQETWGWISADNEYIRLRTSEFAEMAGGVMKQQAIAAELEARGWLEPLTQSQRAQHYVPGIGPVQHYRLKAKYFLPQEEETPPEQDV